MRIHKEIPAGAGLGGGSSNAATILIALNEMAGLGWTGDQLAGWAAQLGADVPFFIFRRPAWATGTGSMISLAADSPELYLVVSSDLHVLSTAEVYKRLDLRLTSRTPKSKISKFASGPEHLALQLRNDLEVPATRIHPGVALVKRKLIERGARAALMSGSGSAVFGVWPDAGSAEEAARALRCSGLWARSVATENIAHS